MQNVLDSDAIASVSPSAGWLLSYVVHLYVYNMTVAIIQQGFDRGLGWAGAVAYEAAPALHAAHVEAFLAVAARHKVSTIAGWP